jgi:hypothetical protein
LSLESDVSGLLDHIEEWERRPASDIIGNVGEIKALLTECADMIDRQMSAITKMTDRIGIIQKKRYRGGKNG